MLRCIHKFTLSIILFFIGFTLLGTFVGLTIGLLIGEALISTILGFLIGLAVAKIVTAFVLVNITKFCINNECNSINR
jgi:hypothetical protein